MCSSANRATLQVSDLWVVERVVFGGGKMEEIGRCMEREKLYASEERREGSDTFRHIESRFLRLCFVSVRMTRFLCAPQSRKTEGHCGPGVTGDVDQECGRESEHRCRRYPVVVLDVSGPEAREADVRLWQYETRSAEQIQMRSNVRLCAVAALVNAIWLQASAACAKAVQQLWTEPKP